MEAKHKQFIRRKLIPFILREHGRGFGMSVWQGDYGAGSICHFDGVGREIPPCGMAACIGGSANVLVKAKDIDDEKTAGKALGLTPQQADGLFFYWDSENLQYQWPREFARAFAQRKTAWGKARVAARLLKEVARTNGECLKNPNYKED